MHSFAILSKASRYHGVGVGAGGIHPGPGTNNARLIVAPEASIVLLLDGPKADENLQEFVWWYIRDAAGNEGWTVQGFLAPSLPPETEESQSNE